MNVREVNKLLCNPALLAQTDSAELRELCEKYPYFQAAQLLLTKKLYDAGDFEAPAQLRRAAISTPSGRRLYRLLFKEKLQELIESELEDLDKSEESTVQEPEDAAFTKPIPMRSLQKSADEGDGSDQKQSENPVKPKGDQVKEKYDEERPLAAELETEILKHAAQSAYYLRSEPKPDEKDLADESPEIVSKRDEKTQKPQKFGDWLRVLDSDQLDEMRKEERKKDTGKLIDEFIEKQPQISKADTGFDFEPGSVSKMEAFQSGEFVSETLAKIYAKQGNFSKAKKIYRNLMTKYPKKKSYFARQIEELEKK